MLYLAVSPVAFFLLAGFAESLFLLLATGCLLAARRRRLLLAGVLAGLAALCRSTGVLLVAPLFVEIVIEARGRRSARAASRCGRRISPCSSRRSPSPAGTSGSGCASVSPAGCSRSAGDLGNHAVAPWTALHDSLRTVLDGGHPEEVINLCASIALVISIPLMWGRLPAAQVAYAAASILPIVCRESLVTPQEAAPATCSPCSRCSSSSPSPAAATGSTGWCW